MTSNAAAFNNCTAATSDGTGQPTRAIPLTPDSATQSVSQAEALFSQYGREGGLTGVSRTAPVKGSKAKQVQGVVSGTHEAGA